jgi:crotonobetainyl-CoA:carnitine CoA-transferase CaiB-like acyl-CoA transferase
MEPLGPERGFARLSAVQGKNVAPPDCPRTLGVSKRRVPRPSPPPLLGEDSADILGVAGYSATKIAELAAAGATLLDA